MVEPILGSSIRVLHVITTIDLGGAEKFLVELVRKQVQEGLVVGVVPLKGTNQLSATFKSMGAKVYEDFSTYSFIRQISKFFFLAKGFDVIHAHLPRAETLACLCGTGKKLIVTRHNAERFWPNGPIWFSKMISNFVINRANSLVAISVAVKQFMLENSEVSFRQDIKVIYYGVSLNSIEIPSVNRPQKPTQIGTIARLEPQKNLFFLLDVFTSLNAKYPELQLKILGEGSLKKALSSEISERDLGSVVEIQSKVSDINSFLKNLDVFVLTSKYEGFGMVLLEASNAKLPIVAPAVSAIPEVLGRDHPGLVPLFSVSAFSDKIIEMLQNESLRNEVVLKQDSRLKMFSPDKMHGLYLETYMDVVKKC